MRKLWIWVIGVIAGLIILAVAISFFIDEPLRRYTEQRLNDRLEGYTIAIGHLDLRPWRFAADVSDVTIMQDANPEPPIMYIPRINAGIDWRALLSGRIVGDVRVERPEVHLNIQQIKQEMEDEVPFEERGWQEALIEAMPLQINVLEVVDATVTYIDEEPSEPLRLSQLNMRAENIRNIRFPEDEFPSTLLLESAVFDSGRIRLEGHANFLAEPHPAVQAQLGLENVELDYVKPIARRYHVFIEDGTLSGTGELTYTPSVRVVHLRQATIDGIHMDYVYTGQPAPVDVERVAEVAEEVIDAPDLVVRADEVHIVNGDIGFMNRAEEPNYRLFLTGLEMHLTDFSNQLTEGTAFARLTGRFMGSGQTFVAATFQPETQGPNFALASSIENTRLQALNNLLRAHGNFDVAEGFFSLYTELRVQNRAITGYVKPLLREVQVFDPDQEKGFFQSLYEGLIEGAVSLLENAPRDEVATRVEISGSIDDPETSTWEVLANLIRNAFFEAILPGFEGQFGRARR